MSSILTPRVVIVRRETELDRVRATYSSIASARFVLERRGLTIESVEAAHAAFVETLRRLRASVPADWRQAVLQRTEVERFLFGPDDIVVTLGQDGLVANVAKYLDGQTVIGVDPTPGSNAGVLSRFRIEQVAAALRATSAHRIEIEPRVMAEATLDGGEKLLALNEIFIGHRSHQSARYKIDDGRHAERQSSSGLIVTTGTGLTGWATSILRATGRTLELDPVAPRLGYLVREAWPGPGFGAAMVAGLVDRDPLHVTSEMDTGGTVFADGIESDSFAFSWGRSVSVRTADRCLNLAVPG